jgi:hypothetical protein
MFPRKRRAHDIIEGREKWNDDDYAVNRRHPVWPDLQGAGRGRREVDVVCRRPTIPDCPSGDPIARYRGHAR